MLSNHRIIRQRPNILQKIFDMKGFNQSSECLYNIGSEQSEPFKKGSSYKWLYNFKWHYQAINNNSSSSS